MDTLRKLRLLISRPQKKRVVLLIFLLTIGMILEVLGIGVLIPILTLVLEPEKLMNIEEVKGVLDYFQLYTGKQIVITALSILLIVYSVKVFYLVFLSYIQNKFLTNFTKTISNRMYSGYMEQPYSFHLKRNSAELIKNFQVESAGFTVFLQALVTGITEFGLAFSVVITLIVIEPVGALWVILFFLLLSVVFFQFIKRKDSIWGKERVTYDNKISKAVMEGLSGIKEIKLLGRTDFFKNALFYNNEKKFDVYAKHITLLGVSRHYLELITVFGLVGFILLMFVQGNDVNQLITTLGVFVAASFRMIPSINRIIASAQILKYNNSSVNVLYDEFQGFIQNKKPLAEQGGSIALQKEISIKNLEFTYDGTTQKVLNRVSLTISKGETVGFMGESGSGKSTLVDLVIGLLLPTKGSIEIDGIELNEENIPLWQRNIGYVPQQIYLTDDTIRANIALGIERSAISEERLFKAVREAQLEDFVEGLPEGVDTLVGERGVQLSGGQRQRIGIARALYHNTEVLVLDEATSALDNNTEGEVMKAINFLKGKKTILIIAHRLSTLESCDRVYEVEKGMVGT